MTAYESPSHSSLAVLDTYNVRWSASNADNLHEQQQVVSPTMNSSIAETASYTAPSHDYAQQAQYRIYTSDGYFDSSARPRYHYDNVWEGGEGRCKQETLAWITSSSWTSHPHSITGPTESFEQVNSSLTTSGSPVTASESHGHGDYIVATSANYNPLAQPIAKANNISSHRVAHQPIPPSQQSKYSELSVNLKFMERLEREEAAAAAARRRQSLPAVSTTSSPLPVAHTSSLPSPASPPNRKQTRQVPSRPRSEQTASASASAHTSYRGVRLSADASAGPDLLQWHPTTKLTFMDPKGQIPAPQGEASGSPPPHPEPPVTLTRNTKEPKKPSLACTFCRERKIACGRPPEGSPDLTCNQCARRSFQCTYVKEHPRNPKRSRKQQ